MMIIAIIAWLLITLAVAHVVAWGCILWTMWRQPRP
jgi:hypothetical protein